MDWLKKLRKERGYKQIEIAKICDITQGCYTHIETGKRKPSVELAKKIAKVLNFEWTLFFENKPDNKILSNHYSKLVVMDSKNNISLAIITNEIVTTASDDIVVKLTPN